MAVSTHARSSHTAAFCAHSELLRGTRFGHCGQPPEMVHPFRRTLADTQLYCRQFQRALLGLPRSGHSPLRAFHPLCGARQHRTRHYQNSLRAFAQSRLYQNPQHVVVDRGLGHNDRIRRIGRCRIAGGAHRIGHRQ